MWTHEGPSKKNWTHEGLTFKKKKNDEHLKAHVLKKGGRKKDSHVSK